MAGVCEKYAKSLTLSVGIQYSIQIQYYTVLLYCYYFSTTPSKFFPKFSDGVWQKIPSGLHNYGSFLLMHSKGVCVTVIIKNNNTLTNFIFQKLTLKFAFSSENFPLKLRSTSVILKDGGGFTFQRGREQQGNCHFSKRRCWSLF